MSAAADARAAVREALAGRRLIWSGIRGEDGEALRQLPELAGSFATIAPLRSAALGDTANVTLEAIMGRRPDLDDPRVDLGGTSAAREFRGRFLRAVSGPCVVMTYRPTSLVAAFAFSMAGSMTLAGMFRERQAAFENKPWVETRLAQRDVLGLGWRYVADEHRSQVAQWVTERPHVLRASRASGGVGIALVQTPEEVEQRWPDEPDQFVAVAPYLTPAVPLNFSGCVFADGSIRLHPVSVQVIGLPSCTPRAFGYCGNDFAAAASLDHSVLDRVDALGRTVGRWLHEEGYLGVFGIDALVHDGDVHFTEVNARFQGSSVMSAEIATALELPDLFLDHLAATLGLPPQPADPSIRSWAREQPSVAQVVVHNVRDGGLVLRPAADLPGLESSATISVLPGDVVVDPGATLCRVAVDRRVTTTGFQLTDDANVIVARIQRAFDPAPNPA